MLRLKLIHVIERAHGLHDIEKHWWCENIYQRMCSDPSVCFDSPFMSIFVDLLLCHHCSIKFCVPRGYRVIQSMCFANVWNRPCNYNISVSNRYTKPVQFSIIPNIFGSIDCWVYYIGWYIGIWKSRSSRLICVLLISFDFALIELLFNYWMKFNVV